MKRINELEKLNPDLFIPIQFNEMRLGMKVIVNGYNRPDHKRFENELGEVVFIYDESEGESYQVAFEKWDDGHDGNHPKKCKLNKCWNFWKIPNEEPENNVDGIEFYKLKEVADIFDMLNESNDEFDWVDDVSKNINENIFENAYFLVNRDEANIDFDLLIKVVDINLGVDPQSSYIKVQGFGESRYNNQWSPPEKVELSWANSLIETQNYWIPVSEEKALSIVEGKENINESENKSTKFRVGDVVIVNGEFQGVEFNNEIGEVVLRRGETDEHPQVMAISFYNWNNNPRPDFQKNYFEFWRPDWYARFGLGTVDSLNYTIKKPDIDTFDVFDQLNESEEDEFGWAKEFMVEPLLNGVAWHICLYSEKDFEEVQKYLFKNGFSWSSGEKTVHSYQGILSVQSIFKSDIEDRKFTYKIKYYLDFDNIKRVKSYHEDDELDSLRIARDNGFTKLYAFDWSSSEGKPIIIRTSE